MVDEHVQVNEPVPGHLGNTVEINSLNEIFVQTLVSIEERRVVNRAETFFIDATFFVYLTGGSLLKASPPKLGD
jgi:hypothetical protein